MIKIASSLSFLIIFILNLSLTIGCSKTNTRHTSSNIVNKQDRIVQIKKSTVRIYVNGKPNGTGFVIDKNGLIATAFHVVGKAVHNSSNQVYITYASSIELLHLMKKNLGSDSLFIRGCISIDPLRLRLQKIIRHESFNFNTTYLPKECMMINRIYFYRYF